MEAHADLFDVIQLLNWDDHQTHSLIHPIVQISPTPPDYSRNLQKPKPPSLCISTNIIPQQVRRENIPEGLVDKRAKNKMAAKQSRERKKQYILTIEKETQAMEEQLIRVERELEECKNEVAKVNKISEQNITGALRSQLVQANQKLKQLLLQGDKPQINAEINLTLDSMAYRFENLGKERVSVINQGYSQILQLAMTSVHKYILWSVKKEAHLFADPNNLKPELQSWFQLKPMVEKVIIQNRDKFKRLRNILLEQREKFGELITKLMHKKEQISTLCGQIDDFNHELRDIYTPRQMAQLILFNQVLMYKEEFKEFEKIWKEDEEIRKLGQPKKMHKPQ